MSSIMKHKLDKIIKIQALFRGILVRQSRLPQILYTLKSYLSNMEINLSKTAKDGRTNSIQDEQIIIEILNSILDNRIYIPNGRAWFDVAVYDFRYGWLPVNIKTSTLKSSDNVGNLSLCLYSYTDAELDFESNYMNGKIYQILIDKIKNHHFNKIDKKDYYFIVINKNNSKDILINSLKGLTKLTCNANNLPFQVKWNDNRNFKYHNIKDVISKFLTCFTNQKINWKEDFLSQMRNLKI